MTPARPRVLALSSGGGHWVQLNRIKPAFAGCDVTYATVHRSYEADVDGAPFHKIPDCNRDERVKAAWSLLAIGIVLLRVRPDVVISTGALPGYFALRLAKIVGARTIWIDSIANAEELSMSGQKVRAYADLWLTQWAHLAAGDGPTFLGSVL
jgi:hypothetical protein